MTNAAPPRPSHAYYKAHVRPERQPYVEDEVAHRVLERWEQRLEAALKAAGALHPEPKDRWLYFVHVMQPEQWAELEAKYPERFKNLMKDYQRLRARTLAGQFDEAET